jgi:uncharacterized protein DUF4190
MSMPPPPPNDPFRQPGSQFPPQPPGFQPYPADAPMPVKQRNSGMAIASLVCSLVGVIPCFWLFQIMGLLGAIFGFVGLKQTKSGERGGRGLAVAGVIIGVVLVVACIAFWIYFATNADCVRVGSRWECTTN